jgi:phenylacetate-CoA ligase
MTQIIRKKLAKTLLFIVYNKVYKNLKQINRISRLNDEELKQYQDEKLKALLVHSYLNVPYYTKVLAEAEVVDSELNVNLDNFYKIPILTKDILRDEFENLKARNLDDMQWEYNTSGGSSGEPARFIQDYNYKSWNIANKIYYKMVAGASIGGKELRLWGSERDILEGSEDPKIVLRNKVYNRVELNMFKMRTDKFKEYLELWNILKPEWVEGYVHVMIEFAKYALENNISVYSPKGILCTAGTLDDEMRKTIEKAFNARVYNRYGSREVGDMACEDRTSKGLRISAWNQKIEVLDHDLNETSGLGNVYITNLNNYAMPLIRYDIGDVAEKGDNWNYLKAVSGRITSIFKTKDGGFFDGCYFRTILSYKDWIKQFQIVQKDYEEIEYIFVPRDENFIMSREEKNELTTNVQKLLGSGCRVTFTFVDEIKGLSSGKYLYTKSEVE